MMMDPSKDYYEQRLAAHAHQAWAAAAAYHNPAAQHYMQRIQQFFPPSSPTPQATTPNPYATGAQHSASSASQNIKEQVYSGNPQLSNSGSVSGNNYPPGHPMHFPGIDFRHGHRASPSPAHSGNGSAAPLPAHRGSPSLSKGSGATDSTTGHQQSLVNPGNATGPLPAHMRSNPYQPTTNYHNLNSSYHPPSQLMHHPSYLPPSGPPPPSNSSHYSPIPANPPHIPQTIASNSSSAMSNTNNSSETSKFPTHRVDYPEAPKSLPMNDPRSIVHNGGLHLGTPLTSHQQHYQNNQPHQRPSDGHNYNNNYNPSATPEDFSNRGRNDSRSSSKDNSDSLEAKSMDDLHRIPGTIDSEYRKHHRISTPTTSNSSPHTFSPYTSQYANMPSTSSTQSPANLPGQQPQDTNYGNAYDVSSYGTHRYSDRLEPHLQQPLQQQHHNSQTIVQPRGPTIDASIKYGSASTTAPSSTNLHHSNLAPTHNQIEDQRRHHHSSGNSSVGTAGSDEQQRISAYATKPTHQYSSMQNQTSVQSSSNPLRHEGSTNVSNPNRIMPPVTGHPYMPQNVPLPPPDVMPQLHQFPHARESGIPNPTTSEPSKNIYQKTDETYKPANHLHQDQSSYIPHQMIANQHLPSSSILQIQPELTTALSDKGSSSTSTVTGSDLQNSLISKVKEKTQSGSWKRKHSVDGKKTSSDHRSQHKKARLSLEAQKTIDKVASGIDDPYAFDDEIEKSSVGSGSNSNSGVEYARFSVNGRQGSSSAGPVYKFKSALLSREQSKSNTPEPVQQSYPYSSPGVYSNAHIDKRADQINSSSSVGALAQNFVSFNSKSVPLRFDSSDNNFSVSCEDFLNDLLSKPISVSRRPSIENWRLAMSARTEKKADKRKAKELRKELAAEKTAALEKALVEKGSVVPAKVKGAAELRDMEKKLDSNSYSYNNIEEYRGIGNRIEDKKSQHVTFSSVPPVQYPSPPIPNTNIGYNSSSSNPGYAISNVSNVPAMQIPAFQPQPQYYSSNSHTLMQNSPLASAALNTSVTSGSPMSSSSLMASNPSMGNLPHGHITTPHPPQRPPTTSNKFDEKQGQSSNDIKYAGKSKSSSIPPRPSDGRLVNEDQKENRPKKPVSNKSQAKGDGSKYKSEKISTSPQSSTKSSQSYPSVSTVTKKDFEQVSKEKDNSRTLQVNGNTNSLQASNDMVTENITKLGDASSKPKTKKGTLWAMPIVPKLPQKPNEKRKTQGTIAAPVIANSTPAGKKTDTLASGSRLTTENKQSNANMSLKGNMNDNNDTSGNGTGALADVWRTAFGAVKPKKPVEVSPLNNKLLIKQEIDAETCKKATYLDIPPEVRRRPKPTFGGLIHFPPDWERAVKRHHEKCRLPNQLIKGIKANAQILCKNNVAYDNKQLSPVGKDTTTASMSPPFAPTDSKYSSLSSYLGNPDNYSPPKAENLMYSDKQSSSNVVNFEKDYPYLMAKNKKSESLDDSLELEEKLPFGANCVVDNILLNRKRLREGDIGDGALGRMYKLPFQKEKRKKNKKSFDKLASATNGEEELGLFPTPGLPLLTADTTEVLMTTGKFGNFRRFTLLRYLDSLNNFPDLKSKLLDWKPEVFETKTRRQSNQVKAVTSYRDIFGIDLPKSHSPKYKRGKDGNSGSHHTSPPTSGTSTPTKKSTKKEKEKIEKATKMEKQTPTKKSKKHFQEEDHTDKEEEKKKIKDPKESKINKEKVESPEKKKDTKEKCIKTPSPSKSKKVDHGSEKKNLEEVEKGGDEESKSDKKPKENHESVDVSKDAILPLPSTSETPIKFEKPKLPKTPRKTKKQLKLEAEARARGELSDDENYQATEDEEQLQNDLQAYALDLLETNKSWERRKIIQNLVIWEAVDPVPLTQGVPLPGITMAPTDPLWQRGVAVLNSAGITALAAPNIITKGGKRKSKKFKKRTSGLDFGKRKSNTSTMPNKTSSRDTSRASSPIPGGSLSQSTVIEPLTEVIHSLDHVVNEGRHWVINKSAGETILHRAAKQGLPDIASYALSMGKMSPTVKDNAGIPPIHKAAFHGHHKIVELLLKFGTDPNTNVKGTRPLHEALEGGSRRAVHKLLSFGSDPLLYDYSGNMPVDISEGNEHMHGYFGSILADLHGKESKTWNVANNLEFTMPDLKKSDHDKTDSPPINLEDTFELSHQPLPAYYRIGDKPGQYALNVDLRRFTSIDFTRGSGLCSRFEVISMSKDEFIRTARCCLLGHKPNISSSLNPHDGLIYLVKVDNYLQKIMGVEASLVPETPTIEPSPPTTKKTKGSDGKNKKSTTIVEKVKDS